MLLLLPCLAILCALSIFYVLARPRYVSDIPVKKAGSFDEIALSLIIPARNEESNVVGLLHSLESEWKMLHEVIVVDDASTDRTAEWALRGGAKVIRSEDLPDGWNGKPWACQQGAKKATGTHLLFVDADVRFLPSALDHLLTLIVNAEHETVYSVCPHHRVHALYEELSAYFNSLMVAGINAFGVGRAGGHHSALFGQSLLISKNIYQKLGGYASVRDKVLENFHLAETLRLKEISCQCLLGKGLIEMRMFPSGLLELWNSWKKGFVSGAAKVDSLALTASSLWITACMLSIVSLACLGSESATSSYVVLATIAYLTNALICIWVFRIAGTFHWLNALCFPFALLFYQILFFSSLIDKWRGKKASWKGRMVQ